ncbi:MAG TPA: hypothetical protein VGK00_11380 [Anaerolineales bacterium]|jgi:hypothetical protein
MNAELEKIATQLRKASSPEAVFGELEAELAGEALRIKYHALVKIVHPDRFATIEDKALANTALGLLVEWYKRSKQSLRLGPYGQAKKLPAEMILQTRNRTYRIEDAPSRDGIFNTYACHYDEHGKQWSAVCKIVRDPHQNEFAQNEIRALGRLGAAPDGKKFEAYFPQLVEAFIYEDENGEHQAMVFQRLPGWHSFEAIHRAYPGGIEPKDMAWMFRRLLVALGFAHHVGILKGTLEPAKTCILPGEHGLMLEDWSHASLDPVDLAAGARLEIAQAVRNMILLSGGDARNGILPHGLPDGLKAFFKGSLLPGKRAPQDAWALKEEFDEMIGRLWGKRKFHPFVMQ